MYIWCAIDLDNQLGEIRKHAEEASDALGVGNPALTLPLHISLKISCEIDDSRFDEAAGEISAHFSGINPFEIMPIGIEICGGVVWIRHRECRELTELHRWLVRLFEEKYSSKPHPFDLEFAYHSSLFVGDEEDARRAYEILKDASLPDRFTAREFVIGCSESGRAGEYRVIKTIENK